ncbi:unnamed protein product, partial [Rotaria socialis]
MLALSSIDNHPMLPIPDQFLR